MPRAGHRHLLVIYKYLVDRWWKKLFIIGFILLIAALSLGILPLLLPRYHFAWLSDWSLWLIAGVSGLTICLGVFLIAIRKKAYVQPLSDHLRLATPFVRVNISYRRFRQTNSAEFQQLFPPGKRSRLIRDMLRPLASQTVLVIELNALPVSRNVLRLFLAPYFFPDKTPRLALLVPDWIAFSTELDSMRSIWQDNQRKKTTVQGTGFFPKK
jgi:hypothetical protein